MEKAFDKEYFISELQDAGALKDGTKTKGRNSSPIKASQMTLSKVTNIKIGQVLAAKSINHFSNDAILKWIRAGRKMTPLIEEQFYMYEQLAYYLENSVSPDDVDEWKTLLNESKFVWPTETFQGWAKIFGKEPKLLAGVEFKPCVSDGEEEDNEIGDNDKDESKLNESVTSENINDSKNIVTNKSEDVDKEMVEEDDKDDENKPNEDVLLKNVNVSTKKNYDIKLDIDNDTNSLENNNKEMEDNEDIVENKPNNDVLSEIRNISPISIDENISNDIENDEQKGSSQSHAETEEKISGNVVLDVNLDENKKYESNGDVENEKCEDDNAEMEDVSEEIGVDFEEIGEDLGEDFLGENTSLTGSEVHLRLEGDENENSDAEDDDEIWIEDTDNICHENDNEGAGERKDNNKSENVCNKQAKDYAVENKVIYKQETKCSEKDDQLEQLEKMKEKLSKVISELTSEDEMEDISDGEFTEPSPKKMKRERYTKKKSGKSAADKGGESQDNPVDLTDPDVEDTIDLLEDYDSYLKDDMMQGIDEEVKVSDKKRSRRESREDLKDSKESICGPRKISRRDSRHSRNSRESRSQRSRSPESRTRRSRSPESHMRRSRNEESRDRSRADKENRGYGNKEDLKIAAEQWKRQTESKDEAKKLYSTLEWEVEELESQPTFKHIVILADKRYKHYLMDFLAPFDKNKVISVVAEEELNAENIERVVEEYKDFGPENALWIVVSGIWSIVTHRASKEMNKRYIPTINSLEFKWKWAVENDRKKNEKKHEDTKEDNTKEDNTKEGESKVECIKEEDAEEEDFKIEDSEINSNVKRESDIEEKIKVDLKEEIEKDAENQENESQQNEESANKMAEFREEFIKKLVLEAYDMKFKILTTLGDNCAVVLAPPVPPAILTDKSAASKKNKGNLRALGTGFNKFSRAWINMAIDMFEDQKLYSGVLHKYNDQKQQFPYFVSQPNASLKIQDHPSEFWFNMIRSLMKLEPKPDKLAVKFENIVVIGVPEEGAADRFRNVRIKGMSFSDVGIRFTKSDNDATAIKLLAERVNSSPNTLWVVLCDMSNWFSTMPFCQRYFLDLSHSMCRDPIKMHLFKSSEMPVDYEKALEFVKKVKPYLGEKSSIILSPVIPQTILLPPVEKEGQGTFHRTLHQKCPASVRKLTVYPPDVNRDEFEQQLLTFEIEWLKIVEVVLRSQNLRVDFLEKYVSVKENNSINILEDPKDYKGITRAYFDWEGFMEEFIRSMVKDKDSVEKEKPVNMSIHHSKVKVKKESVFKKIVIMGNEKPLSYLKELKIPGVNIIFNETCIDFTLGAETAMKNIPKVLKNGSHTLWVFLSDLSDFTETECFCTDYFSDVECTEKLKTHSLDNCVISKKYKDVLTFTSDLQPVLGEESAITFAPVVPQAILCPPTDPDKLSDFHDLVHFSQEARTLPIVAADQAESFIQQFTCYENGWLKVIEQVNNMQELAVETMNVYTKTRTPLIEKVVDPLTYTSSTSTIANAWKDFMENYIRFNCDGTPLELTEEISDVEDLNLKEIKSENDTSKPKINITERDPHDDVKQPLNPLHSFTPIVEKFVPLPSKAEKAAAFSALDAISLKIRAKKQGKEGMLKDSHTSNKESRYPKKSDASSNESRYPKVESKQSNSRGDNYPEKRARYSSERSNVNKSRSRSPKHGNRETGRYQEMSISSRPSFKEPDWGQLSQAVSQVSNLVEKQVIISNLSINKVHKLLIPVVREIDMTVDCSQKIGTTGTKVVLTFHSPDIAQAVANFLSEFRIPDRHLETHMERSLPFVGGFEHMYLDKLQKGMRKNNAVFVTYMSFSPGQSVFSKDLFTFKTKQCEERCSNIYMCSRYHGEVDFRRDPRAHFYSDKECLYGGGKLCPRKNACNMSHNKVERQFHVTRIFKDTCQEWYISKKCSNRYFCTLAHPESPEVLYNSAWYDLYAVGLDQTYEYLVGAIRNLRFINTVQAGVYVLLVTPSIYMVNWLALAVNEVCSDHKKQVAVVSEGEYNIGAAQVVIGTPGGIVQLMNMTRVGPQLACLLIDDASVVLGKEWMALQTILQLVQQNRQRSSFKLNKVVVSERLSHSEVSTYSNFLSTKLHVVDNSISSQQPSVQGSSQAPSAPKWKDAVAIQNSVPSHNCQPQGISSIGEAFNIGKAFSVLNSVCEYLGVLGPSLRSVIMKALDFGSDTASMKALFRDGDSMRLMILVKEKLTALELEFYHESNKKEMFTSAITHIKLLLDEHQNSSLQRQQQSMLGNSPDIQRAAVNDYPSHTGNERSQGASEYTRIQDNARDRKSKSIDYGHRHSDGNGTRDYDRDKFTEGRSSVDYDRERRRDSSDPYRRDERLGSSDFDRGPDRPSSDPYRREERIGPDPYGREERDGPNSFGREERGLPNSYGRDERGVQDPYRREGRGGPDPYRQEERSGLNPYRQEERSGPDPYRQEERSGPDPYGREERGGLDYYRQEERGGPEPYRQDQRDGPDPYRRDEREGPDPYRRDERRGPDPYRREERGGPESFKREEPRGLADFDTGLDIYSNPYRSKRDGPSEFNRGPDRRQSDFGRDYADQDRQMRPANYGREPPGPSGYSRYQEGKGGHWR